MNIYNLKKGVRGAHASGNSGRDKGKLTEEELGSIHSFGSLRKSGKYDEITIESLKSVMGDEEKINSVLACKLIIKLAQRILETAKQTTGKAGGKATVTGAILVFLPGLRDIRGIFGKNTGEIYQSPACIYC